MAIVYNYIIKFLIIILNWDANNDLHNGIAIQSCKKDSPVSELCRLIS